MVENSTFQIDNLYSSEDVVVMFSSRKEYILSFFVAGQEKLTNPFMRVCEQSVQDHTGQRDPIATMESIRREKDNFKA